MENIIPEKTVLKKKEGLYHFVCREDELRRTGTSCAFVNGRPLSLFYHDKTVYALDARCYHAGGPLWQGDVGDIEDFGAVVTCPYHSYKITLKSGERLYKDLNGNLKVAGKRQRTHKVKVKKGNVYVRVSTPELDGDSYDCDRYSTYPIDCNRERKELKFDKY